MSRDSGGAQRCAVEGDLVEAVVPVETGALSELERLSPAVGREAQRRGGRERTVHVPAHLLSCRVVGKNEVAERRRERSVARAADLVVPHEPEGAVRVGPDAVAGRLGGVRPLAEDARVGVHVRDLLRPELDAPRAVEAHRGVVRDRDVVVRAVEGRARVAVPDQCARGSERDAVRIGAVAPVAARVSGVGAARFVQPPVGQRVVREDLRRVRGRRRRRRRWRGRGAGGGGGRAGRRGRAPRGAGGRGGGGGGGGGVGGAGGGGGGGAGGAAAGAGAGAEAGGAAGGGEGAEEAGEGSAVE